jgi:hypothetical protein
VIKLVNFTSPETGLPVTSEDPVGLLLPVAFLKRKSHRFINLNRSDIYYILFHPTGPVLCRPALEPFRNSSSFFARKQSVEALHIKLG